MLTPAFLSLSPSPRCLTFGFVFLIWSFKNGFIKSELVLTLDKLSVYDFLKINLINFQWQYISLCTVMKAQYVL